MNFDEYHYFYYHVYYDYYCYPRGTEVIEQKCVAYLIGISAMSGQVVVRASAAVLCPPAERAIAVRCECMVSVPHRHLHIVVLSVIAQPTQVLGHQP